MRQTTALGGRLPLSQLLLVVVLLMAAPGTQHAELCGQAMFKGRRMQARLPFRSAPARRQHAASTPPGTLRQASGP
jgi:hypothetical protein